jgi:hypothetical protein
MIEDVERYKRVCSQVTYFSDRAAASFNLFIKLTVATVGGYAYLKINSKIEDLLPLARWIIPALAIITSIEILSDLVSWWGFREAEAELLQKPELKPRCLKSGRRDLLRIMTLAIVGFTGFLWLR